MPCNRSHWTCSRRRWHLAKWRKVTSVDNHSHGKPAEMNVGKQDRTGPGTYRNQSTFYKTALFLPSHRSKANSNITTAQVFICKNVLKCTCTLTVCMNPSSARFQLSSVRTTEYCSDSSLRGVPLWLMVFSDLSVDHIAFTFRV
jgi:hypothetical protein